MYYLAIICCALLLSAGISANKIDNDECLRNGGRCMATSECKLPEAAINVCGENQTCCHIVKKEETCKGLGGECIEKCPDKILPLGARSKDCASGLSCCVWLR